MGTPLTDCETTAPLDLLEAATPRPVADWRSAHLAGGDPPGPQRQAGIPRHRQRQGPDPDAPTVPSAGSSPKTSPDWSATSASSNLFRPNLAGTGDRLPGRLPGAAGATPGVPAMPSSAVASAEAAAAGTARGIRREKWSGMLMARSECAKPADTVPARLPGSPGTGPRSPGPACQPRFRPQRGTCPAGQHRPPGRLASKVPDRPARAAARSALPCTWRPLVPWGRSRCRAGVG